jgi:hypothetical protein
LVIQDVTLEMTDVSIKQPAGVKGSSVADTDRKGDTIADANTQQARINAALQAHIDKLLAQSQLFEQFMQSSGTLPPPGTIGSFLPSKK